jgi:phosphoribosylaminoimidazole-succinocarboxamide synthase
VENVENEVDSSVDRVPPVLSQTDFAWLGEPIRGKVRDSYVVGSKRILIATDRLSAFDRIVTSVPGKGQVLTQMARYWFEKTCEIVPNHMISMPDPNVIVGHEMNIIPIEVVVRGYLAGSGWRDYAKHGTVSGVELPTGLLEFDKLPEPIITPSTKALQGDHDEPIAEAQIVRDGIVDTKVWRYIREKALELFEFGSRDVSSRGLVLVDTKYEFGLLDGKVVLADEIHTLDSSRFWVAGSLDERKREGLPPAMLDKEPVRRWLAERGFSGEGDIPEIGEDYCQWLMEHYRSCAEQIIGEEVSFNLAEPVARIESALRVLC